MTLVRVSTVRSQPQASSPQEFNAVKVFSATMHFPRNALGDAVTKWLADHPTFRVSDFVVTQSSDAGFHCLTICVFYRDAGDSSRSEHGAVR
jgi:hypothetical protein